MIIKKGSTDVTTYFKLIDPATGAPEAALTITDLDATYVRDGAAAVKADLTALAAANSAHADNKAIAVDAANCPGLYRVDWPDAAFWSGVGRVQLCINGAAIDPAFMEIELAQWNIEEVPSLVASLILADPDCKIYADVDGAVKVGDLPATLVRSAIGMASANLDTKLNALPTAAGNAAAVRTNLTTELGRIDAAVSSRSTYAGGAVASVTAKVAATIAAGDIGTDAITALAVKADAVTKIQTGLATPTNITAGTMTTVTNLTNIPSGLINAIWNIETSYLGAPNSIGKKLKDWVVGTIDTYTGNTKQTADIASRPTAAEIKTAIEVSGGHLAVIKAKTDNLPASPAAVGSAMTVSDKTGFALAVTPPTKAEIVTELKGSTGWTVGGTMTFAVIMKLLSAWVAGKWQDKPGVAGTYQVMDPETPTTPVMEITPATETPQKTVTVL